MGTPDFSMSTTLLKKWITFFKPPHVVNSILTFSVCLALFVLSIVGGMKSILWHLSHEHAIEVFEFVSQLCCTDMIHFSNAIFINGRFDTVTMPFVLVFGIGNQALFAWFGVTFLSHFAGFRARDVGIIWSLGHDGTTKSLGLASMSGLAFLFLIILSLNIIYLSSGVHYTFTNNASGKIQAFPLINPFAEEFFFRGVLFALLTRYRVNHWIIIVVTGILFGVTHIIYGYHPFFAAYVVTVGIYLGWLYYKTGSLILPFLIHIIGNGLIQLVSFYPQIMNEIIVGI